MLSVFAWNLFVKSMQKEALVDRLHYYYNKMKHLKVEPDTETFFHMLNACGVVFKDAPTMHWFLSELITNNLMHPRFAEERRSLEENDTYRRIIHEHDDNNNNKEEYNNNDNNHNNHNIADAAYPFSVKHCKLR